MKTSIAPEALGLICAQHRCPNPRMHGSRYCFDCQSQIEALDAPLLDKYWKRQSDPAYAYKRQMWAERIKDCFWIALFVGLLSAVGYYLFPFFYATWVLWTGQFPGGN